MLYVIGSGPAGIACADALLKKGAEVTLIDYGFELESGRAAVVGKLGVTPKSGWSSADIAVLKQSMEAGVKGVPMKKAYGSDFSSRRPEAFGTFEARNVELQPSFARGGLSNVWGAAVLPYRADDIRDWPISADDLAPYYRRVFSLMDLSAVRDDLEDIFPIHAERHVPLRYNRQAAALLEDMNRGKGELREKGVYFGGSRLAVQAEPCSYCGLCMYGCPQRLIYASSSTLDILRKNPRFRYRPGLLVKKISDSAAGVRIEAVGAEGPVILEGRKAYLGAGVIPSARILMNSLGIRGGITIKDSQIFTFPWMRFRGTRGVEVEEMHVLSQVFVELFDETISRHTIHLQVYGYNDLFTDALKSKLGALYALSGPFSRMLIERLFVVFGYFHSDDSSSIEVRLEPDGDGGKLVLECRENPETRAKIGRLLAKLAGLKSRFKAVPLAPLLHVPGPGKGFHSGGSFPMRANPSGFESDRLGRPAGLQNVHLIDASTFPSIPATTITLTVMANAARIAEESCV